MPEEAALIPAAANEMAAKARSTAQELWDRSAVFTVTTDDEYIEGGTLLTEVADARRAHEGLRLSITRPMDEAKRRVMELFAPTLDIITDAERGIRTEMTTYHDKRQAEARAAAAAAEEEARIAREAAEKEAAELRAAGKEAEAEAVVYEAATAPTAVVATQEPPKAAGVSSSGRWQAEVTDKLALIKFIAEGLGPVSWLDVNMPALNAEAKSKQTDMKVPGVRAVRKTVLTAR